MGEVILKLKRITKRDGKKHSLMIDQDEAREILDTISKLEEQLKATEEIAVYYKEKYEELIGKLDVEYVERLKK